MKPDFLRSFEFFTGVPDSLLAPLCTWLMQEYGLGKDHIIAANEGNCVATTLLPARCRSYICRTAASGIS